MAEGAKKKRKNVNYTIITIPDQPEYKITRKRTSIAEMRFRKVLKCIFSIIVIALIAGVGYTQYYVLNSKAELGQKVESLNASISDKDAKIAELESKVTVLSGVVEQMTTKERDKAVIESQKHLPTGLPIGGTSSYREDFDSSTSAPILVFEAMEGVDVLATAAGVVTYVGSDDEYLNVIKVDHGNGYETVYRNRSNPKVTVGTEVITGSILYILGPDSRVLGYQILQDGEYIDPADLMQVFG